MHSSAVNAVREQASAWPARPGATQRLPARLIQGGHRFRRSTIEQYLRHQLVHFSEETP